MPDGQHPFELPHDPEGVQPGVGDGAPQSAAPASDPPKAPTIEQYQEISTKYERLKTLEPFAEILSDPATRAAAMSRLFGSGTPMEAAPDPAATARASADALKAQEDVIRAKYGATMDAAIANGDFKSYGNAAAEMGAEIGELRSGAQLRAASGSIVGMTAQNTVETWIANKRTTSPLFVKLEPKFRALVAQTAPAKMGELAINGLLMQALETGWQKVVSENYEQSYNKAADDGRLGGSRQEPPVYSMGGRGGAMPDRERVEGDDKDDADFQELMEKSGVAFSVDAHGAITGEAR
jgi:hypothetical protein